MRDMFAPVPVLLLCTALIGSGCARRLDLASRSRLVVARSNGEAQRLYGIQPFKEEHGTWESEGKKWIWHGLTCSGGQDVVARVMLDERGAVTSVDVHLFANPRPSERLGQRLEPGLENQKAQRIPEVMPR